MRFMVAIDESENARCAFFAALKLMNKEKDHLVLVNVIDDLAVHTHSTYVPHVVYVNAQEEAKSSSKKILHTYSSYCTKEGINHSLVLAISNHVGEMLCQAATNKNIDYLVIGRRGMSRLKRLFAGSSSKYCAENANCNVIVVKQTSNPEEKSKIESTVSTVSPPEHETMQINYSKPSQ